MSKIYFTVTNDLTYDQRMIRICTSLSEAGFDIALIGRKTNKSVALNSMPFYQKRLYCFFQKGKFFYIEYNIRLFLYLFFKKMNGICAIDLDTILPCLWISYLKKIPRVYDAHELFCEMKEIATRPKIYSFWKKIEKYSVPKFKNAYTVNKPIADEFKKNYCIDFEIIRSISLYRAPSAVAKEKFILYQGAVNEGRSFETLIPAMQQVDCPLIICGDGNFMQQAKDLVNQYGLANKITFKGMLAPADLKKLTDKSYIGITLFEKDSKSNYFSLANRFFDYIHSGTPQICVNYPVYKELNNKYDIGILINDLKPETIENVLNELLTNEGKWKSLNDNCKKAAPELSWQNEEKKLIAFYNSIFG